MSEEQTEMDFIIEESSLGDIPEEVRYASPMQVISIQDQQMDPALLKKMSELK